MHVKCYRRVNLFIVFYAFKPAVVWAPFGTNLASN